MTDLEASAVPDNQPNTIAQPPGPPQGDDLEVLIGSFRYTGWGAVDVTRAIDAASGSFRLKTIPVPGRRWPVRPLDGVTVLIGGVPLITGYVDSLEAKITGTENVLTVGGRDRTADMVDSSAVNEPGEWNGLNVFELAKELAEPFGMVVRSEVSNLSFGPVFPTFRINPGDTVFATIERAARLRSLFVHTDGLGALVLTRPRLGGIAATEIVEGENVLTARLRWNMADRFRQYVVLGQQPGGASGGGNLAAAIKGTALDEQLGRPRTLVIIAEGSVSLEDAADRAAWEAANRRARSLNLEVQVPGWLEVEDGLPWRVNTTVHVSLPSFTVEAHFLVRALKFSRSDSGPRITTLVLVPEEAFDPAPVIAEQPSDFDTIMGGDDYENEYVGY